MARRRVPRSPRGFVPEVASARYSSNGQLLQPSQSMSNGVYAFRNFGLNAAPARIQSIAQAYQEYRIKKVTWELRGFYDTYVAPGSATAPSVPHLYWRTDKLGMFQSDTTLSTLKSTGCKPIRLDDKLIRKSFKPVVLQSVAQAASTTLPDIALGSYRTSPWLPTNANAYTTGATGWIPSTIDHLGLIVAIDSDIVAFSSVATISFIVEFEFRKALEVSGVGGGDPSVTEVKLETLSPDYVPPAEQAKVAVE